MLKRILAVVFGFITGFVLVALVQAISSRMYPPPEGLIMQDVEGLEAYFSSLPAQARVIIIIAHVIGCFGGAYIAAKFADRYKLYLGLLVGMILLIAALSYNMGSYSPAWAFLLDLVLCGIGSYLGARLGAVTQQTI